MHKNTLYLTHQYIFEGTVTSENTRMDQMIKMILNKLLNRCIEKNIW